MRFSIGRLMMLVVLAAANFAAFRFVISQSSPPAPFYELLLLGALPMLDVLIVAHSCRKPGRRFLSGFIATGSVALATFVLIAAAFPVPLIQQAIEVINPIFGAGPFSIPMMLAHFLAWFGFYSIPQILIAAVAGWLYRTYRIRLLIERRPDPRSTPAA
jgi:ethanolamine transporter EutH